jgi:hypothetical protein
MILWKELAMEYRKEIESLLNCIEEAYCEFEKKVPNSYSIGLNILEKGIDLSTENVRLLSCSEPMDLFEEKTDIKKFKIDSKVEDDDWLFN